MEINELIIAYLRQTIHSETEVRTKLVIPLFKLLGYEDNFRGEEFPIYGYDGCRPATTKLADILFFDNTEFNNNTDRDARLWVQEHSLIVVELKKPTESINITEGQAQYYSMWSRVPFYIITNGIEFAVYSIENYFRDSLIIQCKVEEIPDVWDRIEKVLRFESVIEFTEKNRGEINNIDQDKYEEYCKAKKAELDFQIRNSMARTISTNEFPVFFSGKVNGIEFRAETYLKLLELKEPIVILGEVGSGKTHLLRMMANKLLESYFQGDSQIIPIMLSAKLWDRSYNSIVQGIKNELNPFIGDLPDKRIFNDIKSGKFIIFIDGFDETVKSLDILINEIRTFQNYKSRIIITCRKQRYYNELHGFAYSCELDGLTTEQIQDYVNNELPDFKNHFFYHIGETLSTLVQNPLFLLMVTYILKNSPNQRLPNNKSELYTYFTKVLLNDWPKSKGTVRNDDLDVYKRILADYSFNVYRKNENNDLFDEYLQKHFKDNITTHKDFLLNTGILLSTVYGPAFCHPSITEFFCAYYLLNLSDEELIQFVKLNHKYDYYREIFIFLSGLLMDSNRQNSLLDILEECNLVLYYRCLKARYKFNQDISLDWDKDFVNKYFHQIRNSYLTIVKIHFSKIQYLLYPWCNLDEDISDVNVSIKGEFNLSIPAISFKFTAFPKDELCTIVEYDYLKGTPSIQLANQNVSLPVISLSSSDGRQFYNLDMAGLGIDSAREIAFETIKKQILNAIDKKMLFSGEDYPLNCELIEHNLDKISSYADLTSLPKGLTLRRNSVEDILINLLPYKDVSGIQLPNGIIKPIKFDLIIYLLLRLNEDKVNVLDCLLPDKDIPWDQFAGKSCWIWSPYSDQQLCKRIERFYDLFRNSYRYMTSTCFPTLLNDLYLYRIGPVKYIATIIKSEQDNEKLGGSVQLRWIPVKEEEDKKTVVSICKEKQLSNHDDFIKEFDELRKQLKVLGRDASSVSTGGGCVLGMYFGDEVLRDHVYEQMKDDFNHLFKD